MTSRGLDGTKLARTACACGITKHRYPREGWRDLFEQF
jgi:hypothetical protein